MKRIGITGCNGFIGRHLTQWLLLSPQRWEVRLCDHDLMSDAERLQEFVGGCDVIVHLAALNRNGDDEQIYTTNISIVRELIEAAEKSRSIPAVIYASSRQESNPNAYGRSKRDGRIELEQWALRSGATLRSLNLPNIYGEYGRAEYNSFVATFAYRLMHGLDPKIIVDRSVELLYVGNLCRTIEELIDQPTEPQTVETIHIGCDFTATVGEVLERLKAIREEYVDRNTIPDLGSADTLHLFSMLLSSAEPDRLFPRPFTLHTDSRGQFAEIVRTEGGGQVSYSTTESGVVRGNHFHTRKIERFAVIEGCAEVAMRRIGTDKVYRFRLDGNAPAWIDIPVWQTHSIRNCGEGRLVTLFWISEPFDSSDPDTYYQEV